MDKNMSDALLKMLFMPHGKSHIQVEMDWEKLRIAIDTENLGHFSELITVTEFLLLELLKAGGIDEKEYLKIFKLKLNDAYSQESYLTVNGKKVEY